MTRKAPAPEHPEAFLRVRSDHDCFGCGDNNPIGLHLWFAAGGDGVTTSFVPATEHQGYDDVIHGGIITAVLDEAMAWATANAGIWAVTAEMSVRFRRSLRVGEETMVAARVDDTRGRLATASAVMTLAGDQTVIATASAKFVRVNRDVEAAWRARYVDAPGEVR